MPSRKSRRGSPHQTTEQPIVQSEETSEGKSDLEGFKKLSKNVDVQALDDQLLADLFFEIAVLQERVLRERIKRRKKSPTPNYPPSHYRDIVEENREDPAYVERLTPHEEEFYAKRLELVKELISLCKNGPIKMKPTTWGLWGYLSKGQQDNKWPSDATFLVDVLEPLRKVGKISINNGCWEVLE